jgi:lysophospholipase L1-like esterase
LTAIMRPALFVLGDSISVNYGPALERSLAGRFRYDRKGSALGASQNIDSELVNGGDSSSVLAFLQSQTELFAADEASILLLNCGLHDVRVDPHSGLHQVEADIYARNLEQIVNRAKKLAQRVVWVRSTPVVDARHNQLSADFLRHNADVEAYNACADAVMQKAGVACVDLYQFTLSLCERPEELEQLYHDHVHFLPAVSQLQGVYLAGWLEAFVYA